jgi:chromosome partitioning protein
MYNRYITSLGDSMYIITIASTKGGVGKSTFILNLAAVMLSKGKKVAILDADSQNTISKWNKVREYMINEGEKLSELFVASARGETLLEIANDKKNQGYFVLIDSPGVDDVNMRSALLRSDFVISTCPPSAVDLWEVESLMNILKKLQITQSRRLPLLLIFNKVPTRHSKVALDDAISFFENNNINPDFLLKSVIRERAVFKHSIRDGKGVIEYSPNDPKASDEIVNCYEEIINIIKAYNTAIN